MEVAGFGVEDAVVEQPARIIVTTSEIAMTRTDHLLDSFFNKSITPSFTDLLFTFTCQARCE